MDLRRIGDGAFGAMVVAAGIFFLALGVGRLSEPIARDATEAPSIALARVSAAPVAAIASFAPESVARTDANARALVRTPNARATARIPNARATVRPPNARASLEHARTGSRVMGMARVRARPLETTRVKHPIVRVAIVASAAPEPRHRYGIVSVHVAPRVERTPEPPIGYEEHPALLRAQLPALEAIRYRP